MGCWNTSLDGYALARALRPADARGHDYGSPAAGTGRRAGPPAGRRRAVQAAARAFGRGAAGLVNALDPHLIAVGGPGRELLDVAGGHVTAAYHDGLMAFRTLPHPRGPARLRATARYWARPSSASTGCSRTRAWRPGRGPGTG